MVWVVALGWAGAAVPVLVLAVVWLRRGGHLRDGDISRLPRTWAWLVGPLGVTAAALAVFFPFWVGVAVWVYLIVAVVVSWVDLDVYRIPNRLLLWSTPAVAGALVIAGAVHGWEFTQRAGFGAGIAGVLFVMLAIAGMGMGDVKLGVLTGGVLAAAGWPVLTTGIATGFFGAAVVGVALAARGSGVKTHLPFGPALVAGAVIGLGVGAATGG